MQFFDINYQLAQADDKAQIFEGYCDFLNYFDASIHVQLTFINQRANMQDFTRSIDIPPRGDEYDGIRREYGDMLKNQLQKGNNGLTKRKYITFGIEADDLRTAKMRLERIETDGMEIEDKRTVYGECTYRLVPREDEPSVCLMHDWIYLPTA